MIMKDCIEIAKEMIDKYEKEAEAVYDYWINEKDAYFRQQFGNRYADYTVRINTLNDLLQEIECSKRDDVNESKK